MFPEKNVFHFFQDKSKLAKSDLGVKWAIILVVLAYSMLHIKFRDQRSIGFGEQNVSSFYLYGLGGHAARATRTIRTILRSQSLLQLHRIVVTNCPVVLEKTSFEIVDKRRKTDGRMTTENGAYLS